MERGRKPGRALSHLAALPVEERPAAPPGREGGFLPPTRLLLVLPLLSPVPKSSVPAQSVQISPGSTFILLNLHRYVLQVQVQVQVLPLPRCGFLILNLNFTAGASSSLSYRPLSQSSPRLSPDSLGKVGKSTRVSSLRGNSQVMPDIGPSGRG